MKRFLALCALFLYIAGQPAFAAASPSYMRTKGGRWGGDGLDAAVSKGAVTETTVLQINATTFTQTASTTYIPKSGSLINSTLTQDWNGTTNVGAGYAGGQGGRSYGAGPAPGGGDGPTPGKPAMQYGGGSASGGSGGGNGGAGGAGEGDYGGGGGVNPGISAGSGGSGAGANSATGGAGGAGGGLLKACAVGVITIGAGGSVNANGVAGSAASNHGGGGGAGGTLYFGSQTGIVTTGNLSVSGGAGATGSTVDGGGGGGGYAIRHAPSGTITGAGTITVSGGAAGGAGATAGSSGLSISIPGTPNLPLLGFLFDQGGMETLKQLAHTKSALTGSNEVEISQYELCNLASNGNVIELAKYLGETMDNSVTTLGVGDVEDKELNAA